jgi:hypothetical protein
VVLQSPGIAAHTYVRWRAEHDDVETSGMVQTKSLAAENECSKRALSNQTLNLSVQDEAMKFMGITGNWNTHTIGDNAAGNNGLSQTGTFNKANE